MSEHIAPAPVLFIFSGLPGSGKSTLAEALARQLGAVYVRVDTIEQALRDLYGVEVQGEGYRLGYRIALDNLRLGLRVVADSCNPIELTRREWERVARDAGASHVNIEVACTDLRQHRSRVESRRSAVPGLELPSWSQVISREYHPWTAERLVIETAGRSSEESEAELLRRLREIRFSEESMMPKSISVAQLRERLKESEPPVVLDVRRSQAFADSPSLIPGATRLLPETVDAWAGDLPQNRQVVAYCVLGQQVSQGVVARLEQLGIDACFLEGGIEQWKADGGLVSAGEPDATGPHPWAAHRSNEEMTDTSSRVTIHMAASLDGFVARRDGSVDWLETSDEFADGRTLEPEFVAEFLKSIDCYVMGSRTYETALRFEAQGMGWSYGDKPTFVLTRRTLPRIRDSVEFYSGDLAELVNGRLRPAFRSIWIVGGSVVAAECLRLGLADELRYSILPVLIGDGIPFFDKLDRDVALHLTEFNAYKSGMVELRYGVRTRRSDGRR